MKKKEYQESRNKYQCFISSTYDDLKRERTECINAILDINQIPAGMEYFEAGRPQKEIIKKWMNESDIVVFIIGGRYGTIDPATGNGYVEDEFDDAINNNKPHFSIILSKLYLKRKESEYIERNLSVSLYEEKNREKYNKFIEKVYMDECVEVNSLEEIKSAIIKNIFKIIQSGKVTGGWRKVNSDNAIDIKEIGQEDKNNLLLALIEDYFISSSSGVEERKIAEQYYDIFQRYSQALKVYITTMAYSIEIRLFDDYIEEHCIANKTYKLAKNVKSSFLYNPWLNEGMESETFVIEDLKYNNKKVKEDFVKRNGLCHTENPLYVKDVVKVEFPYDKTAKQHRVQYSTSYRTNYDKYFHEYIFKEFCQHFSLYVSLQDCRTHKNNKEYMLKWEMFTSYETYDALSQNMLNHDRNKLTLNIADLIIPGNGYIITLNSAPVERD